MVEPEDTIWALKDVSFELERGEVVGIPLRYNVDDAPIYACIVGQGWQR